MREKDALLLASGTLADLEFAEVYHANSLQRMFYRVTVDRAGVCRKFMCS